MRHFLTFNNKCLLDFGAFVSGEGTYNAPTRSVTELTVPGRSGSLLIDNGNYENIEVTYPAYITDRFNENMRLMRGFLLSQSGYGRLEDSFHPDEFYLAAFSDGIRVKTHGRYNRQGEFDLSFNRKPQRFLKTGEKVHTFTADGEIFNPTMFDSKPIVRIYGAGTVGIGTANITFDGSSEYVEIDSDIQDSHHGAVNKNSAVVLNPNEYPVLNPGKNGITVGSGITRVEITPRWWCL